MSKFAFRGLAALAALWWLGLQAPVATAAPERQRASAPVATEDTSQARVIIKFKAGSALANAAAGQPQHAAAMGRHAGWALTNGHVLGRQTQSLRAVGLSSRQLAARLANHPDVEWVQPVQRKTIRAVLPNDPFLVDNQTTITPVVGQWYLRAPNSTVISSINAVGAWDVTQGSSSITVAVVDTGVRFDHPDLAGKLWPGYDFISRTSNSGDGSGVDSDASDPGDFTTRGQCGNDSNGQPLPAENSSWHGTQVAGLIGAATNNGIGMASVGRNVMVLPVRVLGQCGGYDDDIIAGMRWAAGLTTSPANPHPAKVINLSLGGTGSCTAAYRTAIAEINAAGVAVVIAAGNDAGLAVGEPANCPGAIAVAAVRHIGSKVGFSNVGPEVAIAAPGGNCVNLTGACLYPLLTTINNGATTPGTNGYSSSSNPSLGTSFATPLVAGTVGLMMSVDPAITPARIKSLLQASARSFPSTGSDSTVTACHAPDGTEQLECYCTTSTCGAGLLDASAAVTAVQSALAVLPTASFTATPSSPTAGGNVALDGAASAAATGRTLASFQWTITAGSNLAAFVGATSGRTATLSTSAAGTVTVALTVTDDQGNTRSTSQSITIAAAPAVTPPASSGGGGGGAMQPGWLLGLALAIGVLAWHGRRSGRAR